jgi:hypothetical protein
MGFCRVERAISEVKFDLRRRIRKDAQIPNWKVPEKWKKAAVATLFDYAVYEERQFTMERSKYEKKWKWK